MMSSSQKAAETVELLGVIVEMMKRDRAAMQAVLDGPPLDNAGVDIIAREAFTCALRFLKEFETMRGRWMGALAAVSRS